jgi:hypothetical protein
LRCWISSSPSSLGFDSWTSLDTQNTIWSSKTVGVCCDRRQWACKASYSCRHIRVPREIHRLSCLDWCCWHDVETLGVW